MTPPVDTRAGRRGGLEGHRPPVRRVVHRRPLPPPDVGVREELHAPEAGSPRWFVWQGDLVEGDHSPPERPFLGPPHRYLEPLSAYYSGHSGPLGLEELRPDRLRELDRLERSLAASVRSREAPRQDYEPPAPVYEPPAPVYEPSAPVYEAPAPVHEAPAPVYEPPARRFAPPSEALPQLHPPQGYPQVGLEVAPPFLPSAAADRAWGPPTRRAVELGAEMADEDVHLLDGLATLRRGVFEVLRRYSLHPRLAFAVVGYAAIGPLAFAYAELLPLSRGALAILLPAALTALFLAWRHPHWGRRALVGYTAGFLATGIYDMLRLGLMVLGLWADPIPGIGRLLLNDPSASWVWGYAWRFFGNGAGMGLAYAMLPWRGVRSGIVYGSTICLGLFALLAFVPAATSHFFALTLPTGIGAMAGHWVYGAVLGGLSAAWLRPSRRRGRR